jgi:hypothetical protein
VTKGPELTISALRVGIVGTGQQFNLRKREVQALLPPLESKPELPPIKNRVTSSR